MFEQLQGSIISRPGWGLARFLAYALAICVHACSLALFSVGVWLIVAMPNVVTVPLAIVTLFLAFELRPRLGSFRKLKNVRYRSDAPALFSVLDQVAAAVGAKPAHAVVIDASWNAAYGAVGWRRRRVVALGLPLFDSVPSDEWLALLGHEFAHGVNGDALHGTVVRTSMDTLFRLHLMLTPSRLVMRGRRQAAEIFARAVQWFLCEIVSGVLLAQLVISMRARQRAEYLADAIAAGVASPVSMANALNSIVTGRDTCQYVIERRRYHAPDSDFWDQLRSALADVPQTERERRRRASARQRLRATATHPPTHLRVKMLHGLRSSDAAVFLSVDQAERIRAELAADYARIGGMIDEYTR